MFRMKKQADNENPDYRKGFGMTPDQVGQMLTQLGLSAVFLFMLYKLWQRHMYMTDTIIAVLREELKAEREKKAVPGKSEEMN